MENENMTIKEQLIALGMNENEFDNHASDLYVLKNSISTKWLETFEYKNQVKTFKSQTDGQMWYDIPFGFIVEYTKKRGY